jgi:hypothetical protein
MAPRDLAELLVLFYLCVLWAGYALASAALERRMTVAFVFVLMATAVAFCAPLALVAWVR